MNMKKKLLAVTLCSLFAMGFAGTSKAADNADSVLTGTMSSTYAVTAVDGTGTISPTTGAWSVTTNPSFTVVSNNSNYKVRISALAGDSSATQALGVPETPVADTGLVRLVVAKTAATTGAVTNAATTASAVPASNINAIAYDVTFTGTGVAFTTFATSPLLGTVTPTGSTTITGAVGTIGNGSFSTTTDTAGSYTATINLIASDT